MGQEIIKIGKDAIVKAFESAGKSPKQIEALLFELSNTPLRGRIGAFNPEPKTFNTTDSSGKAVSQKYFVYPVYDVDDNTKEIGELAVNRPFDTFVIKGDYQVVASETSPNKGKAMLRSHRMNDLSSLGKSRAEQMESIQGKIYTATKIKRDVVKLFTADKMFVTANAEGIATEANITKLNNNTAVKDLLEITFE
jgi:hypothetical protein